MKYILSLLLFLFLTVRVFGEGTVAETNALTLGTIDRYEYTWTASTNGFVTFTTTFINGNINRVVFDPDSGGTQPDANYDVTLDDANNIDSLAGLGANLDNSTEVSVSPGMAVTDGNSSNMIPFTISGTLSLIVTNAGSLNAGVIVLYVRP